MWKAKNSTKSAQTTENAQLDIMDHAQNQTAPHKNKQVLFKSAKIKDVIAKKTNFWWRHGHLNMKPYRNDMDYENSFGPNFYTAT